MDIKGKVVVITGSSSGIGEATAYLFAKKGARLVINSDSNGQSGEKVVDTIKKDGGEAIYIKADVSDPRQADELIKQTVKKFGKVDVLINNAGGYESQDFLSSEKKEWERIFNNNFFTAVFCSQAAAKEMIKNGGKIINMSSVYGLETTGDSTAMGYSTAKAAIISLTKNLAKLWSPKILVNALAPGYVFIPRFKEIPKSDQKAMLDEMKLGRWIDVEEVAKAYLFLAENDAITGEVLVIDGGFSLKG